MPVDKRRGTILIAILRNACYLTLFGLLSLPVQADSGNVDPFYVRNMNPFTLVYGLPAMGSPHLLARNESYLQLTADIANNSIQSDSDGERIRLDGETYRLALIWKRGIAEDWQIGIELPYLTHRKGVMDGLIENWHDIFGLSNSDREDWSRNRLVYRYENDEGEQVLVNREKSGVGDLVLSLSHALDTDVDSGRRLALHASLKLPTGDSDALLGSGAVDLAFWASGSEQKVFWQWPLMLYGQAGVLLKGEADLLQGVQRDVVFFATLGAGWRPIGWLDLKAQIDAHSSHYDSKLDQLGGAALMLTVGGSIHLDGDSQRIDISIGENLTTDSVPDFMINLAYVRRFDALGASTR
ncbi:MAG: DUF3187 family protein [Candidatus Thiodiazotropha sp.]